MDKKLLLSIFFSSVFLFFSCKGLSSHEQRKNKIADSEYVVLKLNSIETNKIFENSKPTELSHEEILEVEKIIKEMVSKTISNHNKNQGRKDIYSRQYIPAINKNGEKVVWIQFVCGDISETNWKTKILNVSDGGDCVFSLKVNLKEKKYYEYNQNFEG